MLLSGDFVPSPSVVKLLDGIDDLPLPIYLMPGDTYSAAQRAGEIRGTLRPHNAQKIARALGVFESNVDTTGLEQQVIETVSTTMSPLMFEYSLFQRARAERKHIVLPEGCEERILQAAEILRSREVVDLTLLGEEKTIRSRAASLGLKLAGRDHYRPQNLGPARRIYRDPASVAQTQGVYPGLRPRRH